MAVIEKFLGQRVTIPEDRLYHCNHGLWGQVKSGSIFFGMTEPALVLAGGANSLDWLVMDGDAVGLGDSVICMITGKILFIETPVAGSIAFNQAVKKTVCSIAEDPYDKGWLFSITTEGDPNAALEHLADWSAYLESLRQTEGFKNPDGIIGGVSGICKAVYSGIREQKF